MAEKSSDIGKIGGFLGGLAAIITVIITINKSCDDSKSDLPSAVAQKPSTICEIVDSITHEQRRRFRNIKEESFFVGKNAEVRYRSSLNLSSDSSEIIFRNESNKCFYRGFFITDADTLTALRMFYKTKSDIKICLYDWSDTDVVDPQRNFPFTRFIKDNTQIELWYMGNSKDGFSVGLVVEDWK